MGNVVDYISSFVATLFAVLLLLGEIEQLPFPLFFLCVLSTEVVFCYMWVPISSATSMIYINGKVRKAIAG